MKIALTLRKMIAVISNMEHGNMMSRRVSGNMPQVVKPIAGCHHRTTIHMKEQVCQEQLQKTEAGDRTANKIH
jgi:ABC-type dipeptide/oligopeptide/nickel transport system ATPase component